MKHTNNIKMRVTLWAVLGVACLVSVPPMAYSQSHCQPYWTAAYKCSQGCGCGGSSGGGSTSSSGYDYGAARRAQEQAEAAAAAERQRQAEAERIERERLAEEKRQKDAEFIRNRDATANTLKGSSGGADAMSQLKGLAGMDNSGLKGSAFDTGSTGLKELRGSDRADPQAHSKPAPHTDTSVVDARNVPSGPQKSLENAIARAYPDAPPGVSDRVRKGFQAVTENDWKVAKAWFEDALNRDPNNAGLKRLVVLADYTQQRNQQKNFSGKPFTKEDIPPDADPQTYAMTSTKIHSHEAWVKFLFPDGKNLRKSRSAATTRPVPKALQLPEDSDIEFLFGPTAQPLSSKSGKTKSKPEPKSEEGILDRAKRVAKETRERDPQIKEKLKNMPRHGGSVGGTPAVDEVTLGGKG